MSPPSAPTLLERPSPEDGATGRIELTAGRSTPAIPVPRPATTALMRAAAAADAEAAAEDAVPVETVVPPRTAPDALPAARRRLPRLAALRRLPHPPGRRAPIWLAALVSGALVAGAPAILGSGSDQADVTASDLGLGLDTSLDLGFSGGLDDAGVRRGITEAEAQARLGELAASRAAREPKTVIPLADYRLTTCFCMRWGQMHNGWDMAAPLGTPIYAAADGVVLSAGRETGYGNAVSIQDEDGNVHVYGHMRYYDVKAGQIVRAGDQIAKVGNEGFSTGPHVHWQIHRGGTGGRPLDPKTWLADRGVSP